MTRIRYRTPSIDRECGSEPDDVAEALRNLGLVAVADERLEALGLDQHGRREAATVLEYAGARWAIEPTYGTRVLDLWADPWMGDALKAVRKHPAFRTGGAARNSTGDARLMAAALLRSLVRAAARDSALLPALSAVKTMVPVGGRGEAMAAMLMARRVWSPTKISTNLVAWGRALAVVEAP